MATYNEIYGKRVEVFDSDPTLSSAYEGQVWYNSTTGANKAVVQIKAFSSGGNVKEMLKKNILATTTVYAVSYTHLTLPTNREV
mgnify:CR=1 FL=1